MKKMTYSKEVDALLIELSDEPISYAEEEDNTILHYSENNKLVLIKILNFRRSVPEKAFQELLVS